MLQDPDPYIRHDVAQKLQETDDLGSDVIDQLQNLFDNGGDKKIIAAVLQSRLHLVPDALEWLVDQAVKHETAPIPLEEALNLLIGQMELPVRLFTNLFSKMLEFLQMDLMQVLYLGGDIREAFDGFWDHLPELFRRYSRSRTAFQLHNRIPRGAKSEYINMRTALFRQNWFRKQIIELLSKATTEAMVEAIEWALSGDSFYRQEPEPLDDESILILKSLVTVKTFPDLMVSKSKLAHEILCGERGVDSTITFVDRITYHFKGNYQLIRGNTWTDRDISQFCANLISLGSLDMELLINAKLEPRSNRSINTAYIHGQDLFCYDADGTLHRHKLADEIAFRASFAAAQMKEGLPKWAWVKVVNRETETSFCPTDKIGGRIWQSVIRESLHLQ